MVKPFLSTFPVLARLLGREEPAASTVLSRLENGFIVPPTNLELIVADHCNITCRSCNHLAPLLGRWFANPDVVHRDLSILAKVYRPKRVKVIGGEPLLHKDLAAVIRAARSSGISPYFFITTNGLLLDRMSDHLWGAVDEIEVSAYPGAEPSADILGRARQKACENRVKFTLYHYEEFRATLTTVGTQNQKLIDQIYRTCKLANVWGCHGVRDGRFFKCPQSIYIPKLTGRLFEADHVPIEDTPDLKDRLLAFVNSPRPLSSCTYCVGTVGKKHGHVQLPRQDWPADLNRPTEEMVDYECLDRARVSETMVDDCKIPTDKGSAPAT